MRVIEISAAVAAPGEPVPLAPAHTNAVYAVIQARKLTGENSGDVFLGTAAVDKDARQTVQMSPGDTWEPAVPHGRTLDLSALYVDAATAGDGVTGLAFLK